MESGVERLHGRLSILSDDNRDAAVIENHLAGLVKREAEEACQIGPVDDMVAHHQNRLAGMVYEEIFQRIRNASVDIREGFAAGITEFAGPGHEALVRRFIAAAYRWPVEPFPPANVTFGQRLQRNRRDIMRRGHNLRRLNGPQ